ncbi:MAG: DUF1206 domain-containing protein [Actinomycetota bacterium]|nr:DUF1206 domain-containing protein [Actinomycetota bacterium]
MTAAYRATRSPAASRHMLSPLARLGLGARAFIYLMIGLLAVLVALGHSTAETDQSGALQQIDQNAFGHVLIWVLAGGLSSYALWRFSEVIFGVAGDGRTAGGRLQSLVRGVIYSFFAANAYQLAVSNRTKSQASRQVSITADVMSHSGGRVLVGIVGAVVVLAGLILAYGGVTRRFEKYLATASMSRRTQRAVRILGMIGTTARGSAFALTGVFVVQAALDYNAQKAGGLDQALRSLRDTSAGPALLLVVALGLVAFGVYGFAEARWRMT